MDTDEHGSVRQGFFHRRNESSAVEPWILGQGIGVWRIGGAERFWSARTFRYRFCGGYVRRAERQGVQSGSPAFAGRPHSKSASRRLGAGGRLTQQVRDGCGGANSFAQRGSRRGALWTACSERNESAAFWWNGNRSIPALGSAADPHLRGGRETGAGMLWKSEREPRSGAAYRSADLRIGCRRVSRQPRMNSKPQAAR